MNTIAFFTENSSFTYTAVYTAFGAAAAFICSVLTALYLRRRIGPVIIGAAVSVFTGVLCARLVYWYCRPEQFSSFFSCLTDFRSGGYSLAGAFAGVLIAAVIVRAVRLTDSILSLLDCYAPGAAIGIAIGRLGGFFTTDDKGNFVFNNSRYFRLPFSFPVTDEVTGSVEWRFATFFWESVSGFVIFAAIAAVMVYLTSVVNDAQNRCRGALFMTFLSLFGATQATLESMRYDSLRMRSNGFISMTQLAALIMLLVPLVFYLAGLLRAEQKRLRFVVFCSVVLLSLGGAGVTEYFVQRKARYSLLIYPAQLLLLLVVSAVTLLAAYRIYCRDRGASVCDDRTEMPAAVYNTAPETEPAVTSAEDYGTVSAPDGNDDLDFSDESSLSRLLEDIEAEFPAASDTHQP